MKKLVAFCLFLFVCLPAVAVEDSQVMYVGGTAPGMEAGAVGRFDFVPLIALIFDYAGGKLTIPYADIQSFGYSREVTRHLGGCPRLRLESSRCAVTAISSASRIVALTTPNKL